MICFPRYVLHVIMKLVICDMKKIIFLFLFALFFSFQEVDASNEVPIYLFYGDTCPICEEERIFLKELKEEYDFIQIYEIETYRSEENNLKLEKVKDLYRISSLGVPFTVIGDTAILGFQESTKSRFISLIEKYQTEDFQDRTGHFLETGEEWVIEEEEEEQESISSSLEEEMKFSLPTPVILLVGCLIILLIVLGIVCYFAS